MAKMHTDEIYIDDSIVTQLITLQFPQYKNLSLKRFHSAGTDNAIYRLGDGMSIRLPITPDAATRIAKEHKWLPKLAPLVPLKIPTILARGMPTEDYPAHWTIYQWLDGKTATIAGISNPKQAAETLAQFIATLHKIDAPTEDLTPGQHNFFRGEPLILRDAETRAAISKLHGTIDTDAASKAWEAALATPEWSGHPVLIHGDLLPGNLLLDEQGKFSAVIDFGGLGVGDPAYDLITAWCLFSAKDRKFFRSLAMVDKETWKRGRGLALSIGLVALSYYKTTNPDFAAIAEHMIDEVLIDHRIIVAT
jgi:aminoglycoside phosphotransferase (APT) family kinase protein